jgi:hypothetical protein
MPRHLDLVPPKELVEISDEIIERLLCHSATAPWQCVGRCGLP